MKIRTSLVAVSIAFALTACGNDADDDTSGAPPPIAANPAPVSKFATVKVAHILIGKDGQGRREPKITRSKADALALAKSLLEEIKGGRDFLEVAQKFSEDVTDNKLNTNCGEPGVYEGPQIEGFDPAWKAAALATPVGAVAPEPVESVSYGYFLIKRLK